MEDGNNDLEDPVPDGDEEYPVCADLLSYFVYNVSWIMLENTTPKHNI